MALGRGVCHDKMTGKKEDELIWKSLLIKLRASGEEGVVSGVFLDVDYIGRDREREWGEVRGARVGFRVPADP